MYERAKKTASFSVKAGGTLGGVSGFVGDFLTPIAPFGVYVAAVALGALLLALVLWAVLPKKVVRDVHTKYGLDINESIWFGPLAVALLLLTSVSYASYKISSNFGDNNSGVLGGVVPEIHQLQQSLGMIEINTREMVEQQRETNQKLEVSNRLQGDVVANTGKAVEQQTITNKGVFWNLQTLQDALIRGDIETLEMFRSEGHDLRQINQPSSGNPMGDAMIVYAVRQNHRNMDGVLAYLVKHGVLELDKNHHSAFIMNPNINAIWQRMEVNKQVEEFIDKGSSFSEFQQAMLAKGYEIPDELQSGYKKFSGAYIAGPVGIKTTLLIEALYAGNVKAAKYLSEHTNRQAYGYIELSNGVKIRLVPHLIASQAEEKGIRTLAANLK